MSDKCEVCKSYTSRCILTGGRWMCPGCLVDELAALRAELGRVRDRPTCPVDVVREGGWWLGAARNYIKRSVPHGEHVTWGSGEPLAVTVRQVEEIAAEAVAADRAALAEGVK